ncbi:O-antigen ligase family protein [Acinetobacter junii]|uniref:O-antigen ligase family protein n=1 Tax=Acinetobacter junii TaxID=40215 RepID=UPI00143BB7CE|nr:O-antigen ligase family protein [Acinetobacter junii]NKG35887.1 hypothetical protein [Acinetobacter junii]
MLINYRDSILAYFFYFYIFILSFIVGKVSFDSNFNTAYSVVYLVVLVLFFYGKDFFFSIFSYSNKYIFFLILVFSISSFLTPLVFFKSMIGLFKIYSVILFGFVSYFLIGRNIVNIYKVFVCISMSGFVHVLIILWMWFTLLDPKNYDWVSGLYFSNNIRNFTDYISISFFCSYFLMIRSDEKIFKFLFGFISFFILTCIVWSGSRTAYIGIFFGLFFVFCFFSNLKLFIQTSLIIIFSVLSSFLFLTNHSSLGLFRVYYKLQGNVNEISSGRLAVYKDILEYFSYYPIFGYGGEAVKQLSIYGRAQAHNNILQILIEYGIVGLAFVFLLSFKFIKDCYNCKKNNIEIFSIAMIINIVFASFFNGGFYYAIILIFMCLFFGVFYAAKNIKSF